jgi:hypothetical protein
MDQVLILTSAVTRRGAGEVCILSSLLFKGIRQIAG